MTTNNLQTWEDPRHIDDSTGAKGDNDPIDIIEIGSNRKKRGDIIQAYNFCTTSHIIAYLKFIKFFLIESKF